MKKLVATLKYTVLLLPIAVVAGTAALYRYGPPVWQLYVLYSVRLLTHPLILLFLALTVAALAAAMVLRRRRRSELLGFCFLLSAVLHLLTVAMLSLWLVEQAIVEDTDTGGRHEVMTGLPSFAETTVGEDLRGLLQDIATRDRRALDARAETEQPVAEPAPPAEPAVTPPRDQAIPARQPIPAAQPPAEPRVDEPLERRPSPAPVRDATRLVRMAPLETPIEPETPARPPTRTLTVTPDAPAFTPVEPSTAALAAPLPAVDRTTDDRAPAVPANITPADPRVDASLQQPETAHTVDRLAMYRPRPETMPTEQSTPHAPAARDVSAMTPAPARPTPADAPSPSPTPEITPAAAKLSVARLPQELPALDAYLRVVSERASEVAPGRPAANTAPVDVAGARPAPLPETADRGRAQPRPPTPRELSATRAIDTPADLRPLQARPTIDAPTVDYIPVATPVATVTVRPTAAPNVIDALSAPPAARALASAPAVAGRMVTMATARDDASATDAHQTVRDLQAPRQAASGVPEPIPVAAVDRPHDVPSTPPRPMASLADANAAPTAMPTAATPTAVDALPIAAPGRVPGAITVDVGGRLMLVEPAARVAALQPAALTSRDIEAAYRRETPETAASLPAAALTAPTATPTATPRVSPHSIAAADSIRLLQAPGQTPTVDTELTEVTPGRRAQRIEVSHALAAMTLPTTGEVARVHGRVDARTFAENRVAMQSPVRAALPAEPTRRRMAVPAATGTQAPVTFSPAASTPATAMAREAPRAHDDALIAAAGVVPDGRVAVSVASQIAQVPVTASPESTAPDLVAPRASRDFATARRHVTSEAAADAFARPAPPTAVAGVRNPSSVTTPTWTIQTPTLAERAAAVDSAAVRTASGLAAQPMVRIDAAAATAEIPTEAPARLTGPATAATDTRTLRVARVVPRAEDALPEDAIPPPRTTFLDTTPRRPSVAARLPPVAASGSSRRGPAARAADISDRLAAPERRTPLTHESPLMDVALAHDAATGMSTATASRPPADQARDRAFDLARTEDRAWPTANREPGRPVGLLPRPEFAQRASPRIRVALNPAEEPRAAHVEDATSSAGDSVRGLMAAEIAASRESPSKKAIYQLRSSSQRREHIEELGGSVRTEAAVEQALDWLAGAQSGDGHWDVDDFKGADVCGGRGNQASADVGITGLTLLAFLGAGYTHIGGKHQAAVKRAVNWLIAGMAENGDLRQGGQMYDQAMATAALCETLSLTSDARLLPAAKRAVQFILDAQSPEAAWRYNPREDSDTSVTGWQILALKSAEVAGIGIPPEHYRWTEKWLDKVRQGEQGGLYLYQAGHAVTPVMTAEGWFCQIFMGEQSNTRGQEESTAYVMEHLPVWSREVPGAINFYYWYYATLALHLSGSESFGLWNDALTTALLQGRVSEGPAAGTWDPVSHIGVRGGRIYSTAMATLCLEVYYRFLPFYKLK